jgi:hypothetical protein
MPENDLELRDVSEAYALLKELGASERLLTHVQLVGEAAEMLIRKFKQIGLPFDAGFVRLGVALHDAGKTLYPEELNQKGSRHEAAGQELLLSRGVAPRLARCCVSHGQWRTMDCSIEELLIALSDKLWKGKREETLEKRVIEEVAKVMGLDQWELMIDLDSSFERIASQGPERLMRSAGRG